MTSTAAIAQVLTSTLNPDSSIRISAELSLSELLKSPRERFPRGVPSRIFLTRYRIGALTCATYSLSGCRVLPATDESGCALSAQNVS
jgi:hypothetical protein